jgi:ubiquinone/menaquinone biosynthesis C-methylase UbiE
MVTLCPACKELNSMTPYMGLEFGKFVCKRCGFVGMKFEQDDEMKKDSEKDKEIVTEGVEEKNREVFDNLAPHYDKIPIIARWVQSVQKKVVRSLKLKPSTTVLDVGCGTGHLLIQLAPHIKKVVGIDLSQKMLDHAKEKTARFNNVELVKGSVTSLPFERNSFDYVIATEMFHHVEKPIAALKEMKRVVKHNGFVIVADIHIPPIVLMNLFFKLEPGFVRMYNKIELYKLFKKANLRVVSQKRVGLCALMTKGRK